MQLISTYLSIKDWGLPFIENSETTEVVSRGCDLSDLLQKCFKLKVSGHCVHLRN